MTPTNTKRTKLRASRRAELLEQFGGLSVDQERWLDAQEYEPEWLYKGIAVRNTITVLAADLGAGKTIIEQGLMVKEAFPAGLTIVRMDLENDLDAVILPRFFDLGATHEQIAKQYVHLTSAPGDDAAVSELVELLNLLDADCFTIDATADAMQAWGADPTDNAAAMDWSKRFPERIVAETNCGVLLHDHFGWSNKAHAIGATSKLANVTISWNLRVDEQFSRELVGAVRLELSQKNRLGVAPPSHSFSIGGRDGRSIFMRTVSAEEEGRRAYQDERLWNYLLANGPLSGAQLERRAKKIELTRAEIRKSIKRLARDMKISQLGEGPAMKWQAVEYGAVHVIKAGQ